MFNCLDCKIDTTTEYYSVKRSLWEKANPKIKGMLCIGCLELRLGRQLVQSDFTQAPINKKYLERKSKRLKNRLGL